jgi:hypothetical protein
VNPSGSQILFLMRNKNIKNGRRVDYPIKSKGYRKKSTFPVECE